MAKKKKKGVPLVETPLELYRRLYRYGYRYLRKKYPKIRAQRGQVRSMISAYLVKDITDGDMHMPGEADVRTWVDLAALATEEG